MTEFSKYALAYGIVVILLGLPLLWAILAMRRQLTAGHISRDPGNDASRPNPIAQRAFWWGLLVAAIVSAKVALSKSQHLLGLVLLMGAGFTLLQLYRLRRAKQAADY